MGKQPTTWKHSEREIARLMGGTRTGPAGKAAADVVTGWAVIEVKHRKALPQWIKKAVEQAVAAAGPRRVPLAVLHEKGKRYMDSLVVMRMSDFIAWYGDPMNDE